MDLDENIYPNNNYNNSEQVQVDQIVHIDYQDELEQSNISNENQMLVNNNQNYLYRCLNFTWDNFIEITQIFVNIIFSIVGSVLFLKNISSGCNIIWLSFLIVMERLFETGYILIAKNTQSEDLLYKVGRVMNFIKRIMLWSIIIWFFILVNTENPCQDITTSIWKFTLSYLAIVHLGIFFLQIILVFIISCGFRLLFPNLVLGAVRDFPVRIGASDNELDNLKTFTYSQNKILELNKNDIIKELNIDDLKCSICLENYNNNEQLRLLDCNHHFHKKCCDDWLKINKTCPMCRNNIDFD